MLPGLKYVVQQHTHVTRMWNMRATPLCSSWNVFVLCFQVAHTLHSVNNSKLLCRLVTRHREEEELAPNRSFKNSLRSKVGVIHQNTKLSVVRGRFGLRLNWIHWGMCHGPVMPPFETLFFDRWPENCINRHVCVTQAEDHHFTVSCRFWCVDIVCLIVNSVTQTTT